MGELSQSDVEDAKKLEEEHKTIKMLADAPLQKADSWYLIDARWFKQWEKYVTKYNRTSDLYSESDTEHPGLINNAGLFADESCRELREHLIEDLDYGLLPREAWEVLMKHYGKPDDQPVIERKVIEQGKYSKSTVVEIYPLPLKLCSFSDKDNCIVKKFSRVMTIDELDKEMRKLFSVNSDQETRLWNAFLEQNYEKLEKSKTIESYSLQKNQLVVMEVKNPGEDWKIEDRKSSSSTSRFYNGSSPSIGYQSDSSSAFSPASTPSTSYQLRNSASQNYGKRRLTPGLCGLNNLGNTCFMNSALQCLSNVPALTNYFKSGNYRKDLNTSNPLGMGGKIAKNYAHLIEMIWSGEHTSFAPREFKYAVGQFQSRFLGYQQQDSQELLAFLIDGLHEDLNRISKKPYIEARDADGRPDQDVAKESWENHQKRNDSIIVETLHGLFRSIVDCPECSRLSVTFDPFCFLSLPLPVKREKTVECTFVPLDIADRMIAYKVTVPKSGIIKDVCKAVSKLNDKPHDNMVATDVYNSRFHKIFQSSDQVRSIYDKDLIYIFETPPDAKMIPVYLRYVSESGSAHLFGQPLLIPVYSDSPTYAQIYRAILKASLRYIDNEMLKSEIANLFRQDVSEDVDSSKDDVPKEQEERSSDELFNLFRIKAINSFGTQEYKHYDNDDELVKLNVNATHLSADWPRAAYDNHFTTRWSDAATSHESLNPSASKKTTASVNLTNCMELFTSKEQLEKDNTWYCSDCKKHQQAYKKFDLWMLPPVLIVHLKRFSNSRFSRDKLDTFIDFPLKDLDLSAFVVNPLIDKLPEIQRKYNLIAVSNHYGGLGGGHYTAFAKNHIDKQWHYFDDSSVSLSSEERVVTKAAYMLVYIRQDVEKWSEENPDKPFPFLEPVFSPRAMKHDAEATGSSFHFQRNEDLLNNNNADDAMDTT